MSDMILMLRCSVSPLTTGSGEPPPPPPPPPPAGNIAWGWDPAIDLGTTGDWYVDASVAASGDGRTPATAKKTIAEARNAASSGQTVKIMGHRVKYRETIMGKSGLTFEGYGTDKPIITGANVLSGSWANVSTSSGEDADRLGKALAASGNIWVWRDFDLDLVAHTASGPRATSPSARSLNLHENGTKMTLCQYWQGGDLGDKYYAFHVQDWHDATSVNTSGGKIISYVDARVFADLSDAQILNCTHYGHCRNNSSFGCSITSVNRATNTWVVSDQSRIYETNANKNRYSFANALPAMEAGHWGYWSNGDGTIDIYIWPTAPALVNNETIEYSARVSVLDLNFVNNFTVRGLDMRQVSGTGTPEGSLIIDSQANTISDGITIEHCRLFGCTGESAITLYNAQNLTIRRNTIFECPSGWSNVGGDTASAAEPIENTVFSRGNLIEQNHVKRTGGGSRNWAQAFAVIAHNKCEEMGLSAHANKQYCYEQNHNVLFWGNTYKDCDGYATWQESSAIHTLFCYIPATRAGLLFGTNTARCMVDQNNATTPPSGWTTPPSGAGDPGIIACNALVPIPEAVTGASNALSLGNASDSTNDSVRYDVLNNLMHGWVVKVDGNINFWGRNYLTAGSARGSADVADVVVSASGVWTDPGNGDYSIRTDGDGATVRAAVGVDLTSRIAALRAKFPRFANWTLDAAGDVIDLANPPIGCFVDHDRYAEYQNTVLP